VKPSRAMTASACSHTARRPATIVPGSAAACSRRSRGRPARRGGRGDRRGGTGGTLTAPKTGASRSVPARQPAPAESSSANTLLP
jgi:hypothetical protein